MEENKTNEYMYFKPSEALHRHILSVRAAILYQMKWYNIKNRDPGFFLDVVKPVINELFLLIRSDFTASEEEAEQKEKVLSSYNVELIKKLYYEMDRWLKSKNLTNIYTTADSYRH
jgi:hypothetical protein